MFPNLKNIKEIHYLLEHFKFYFYLFLFTLVNHQCAPFKNCYYILLMYLYACMWSRIWQCACGGQSITWGLCSPFPVCESPGLAPNTFTYWTISLVLQNIPSVYLKATVLRREDLSMSTTSLIQRWALSSSTSVFLVISWLHRHTIITRPWGFALLVYHLMFYLKSRAHFLQPPPLFNLNMYKNIQFQI